MKNAIGARFDARDLEKPAAPAGTSEPGRKVHIR
jgi:hypothetical protein